jgi:thioredoxin
MTIVDVNKSERLEDVVRSTPVPVLVYFSAVWCGPCRVFRPRIEELVATTDKLMLVNVDVDSSPELTEAYGVQSVPTIIGFFSGTEGGRLVGVKSDADVKEFIERLKS